MSNYINQSESINIIKNDDKKNISFISDTVDHTNDDKKNISFISDTLDDKNDDKNDQSMIFNDDDDQHNLSTSNKLSNDDTSDNTPLGLKFGNVLTKAIRSHSNDHLQQQQQHEEEEVVVEEEEDHVEEEYHKIKPMESKQNTQLLHHNYKRISRSSLKEQDNNILFQATQYTPKTQSQTIKDDVEGVHTFDNAHNKDDDDDDDDVSYLRGQEEAINIAKLKRKLSSTNSYFILSQFSVTLKNKFMNIINELNGHIVENFNSNCQYVIADKLNRSEKILSALIINIPILHTTYLIDSYQQGYFIHQIEKYQWQNITNKKLTIAQQEIQNCIGYWHQQQILPFSSLNMIHVIIFIKNINKANRLKKLLVLGGTTIVTIYNDIKDFKTKKKVGKKKQKKISIYILTNKKIINEISKEMIDLNDYIILDEKIVPERILNKVNDINDYKIDLNSIQETINTPRPRSKRRKNNKTNEPIKKRRSLRIKNK